MAGSSSIGQRLERRDRIRMQFQPGQLIADRYEVVSEIGTGAMGVVLKVKDRVLNDEAIALKFLYRSAKNESVFHRFRNEALLTRTLTHQNIIRVHDFGEAEGGHFFISMEYIAGYSLGTIINSLKPDRLPFHEVIRVLKAVAAGVGYAHKKGVVHRDIKPDNVLLSHDGEIRVTDFGLARALHAAKSHTAAGQAVGTPFYMAPEQIQGTQLDPRCDIYSMGILAYEMVTGDRPFIGDDWPTIANKHLSAPLPKAQIKATIPAWFQEFLEICCAKDRKDRFSSMEEAMRFIDMKMGVLSQDEEEAISPNGTRRSNTLISKKKDSGTFHSGLPLVDAEPTKKATFILDEAVTADIRKGRRRKRWMRRLTIGLMLCGIVGWGLSVVPFFNGPTPLAESNAPTVIASTAVVPNQPPKKQVPPVQKVAKVEPPLKERELPVAMAQNFGRPQGATIRVGRTSAGGSVATNALDSVRWSATVRGLERELSLAGIDQVKRKFRIQIVNPKTDVIVFELLGSMVNAKPMKSGEVEFSGTLASVRYAITAAGSYIVRVDYDGRALAQDSIFIEKAAVSFSGSKATAGTAITIAR